MKEAMKIVDGFLFGIGFWFAKLAVDALVRLF